MLGSTNPQEFWESQAAYERHLANEQERRDNAEDDDDDTEDWDGWPEPDPFDLED